MGGGDGEAMGGGRTNGLVTRRHPTDGDLRTRPKKMTREAANVEMSPQAENLGPVVAAAQTSWGYNWRMQG